ncbi:MAG: hypothetical protein JWO60_1282 [Frankiales bacterium]|nr:hypothetical protein [Frankiales bacterium]
MAVLPFLLAVVLGYAGGRYAGWRGWFVVPVVVVVPLVADLAVEGFIDPFLFLFALLWGLFATVAVVVGLAVRKRARPVQT